MVYSTLDALRIADAEPAREVVFFAIGFETTTPPTAVAVQRAARDGLGNFSVFCNHVLTPVGDARHPGRPAAADAVRLDGFVGPAHVSTVIGTAPYRQFAAEYRKPVVVAGFEPLDVMQAILMLVRQVNDGPAPRWRTSISAPSPQPATSAPRRRWPRCSNCATASNGAASGWVPHSALRLRAGLRRASTPKRRFGMETPCRLRQPGLRMRRHPARREERPADCRLFGTACTPETPMGSCMVSSEGACAAHWTYGPVPPRRARLRLMTAAAGSTSPHGRVDLSHGAGGRAMAQLIADIFHADFGNDTSPRATTRRPSTCRAGAWS